MPAVCQMAAAASTAVSEARGVARTGNCEGLGGEMGVGEGMEATCANRSAASLSNAICDVATGASASLSGGVGGGEGSSERSGRLGDGGGGSPTSGGGGGSPGSGSIGT